MQSLFRGYRMWWINVLWVVVLAACGADGAVDSPRETVPAVLYITPAPTLDVNATVTAYALAIVPTPTPSGLYIVKSGDTLSGIASDFGTTVEDVMELNGIDNPEMLQVGQPLIIPSLVDRTPLPAPTFGPQDTPTIEPTEEIIPDAEATATPTS